jgi:hypothetical protein
VVCAESYINIDGGNDAVVSGDGGGGGDGDFKAGIKKKKTTTLPNKDRANKLINWRVIILFGE